MSGLATASRVQVDGKFFRLRGEKFYLKGVTYGPFAPNAEGEHFAAPEKTARDFASIRVLGANVVRVYLVPPRWFMDLAAEYELKLLVDVTWPKQVCFLDSEEIKEQARQSVREAARKCAGHPAVFALSLTNEIPPDIARWSGARKVSDFIDELAGIVKEVDPDCLCTFSNFPPTEFLRPRNIDFHCFNVYLHQPKAYESYLARLQMIADTKPLILGEIGVDSFREGEERKCDILSWKIETAFRAGLAGAFVYSFTDDWHKDGRQIEDWAFGLTTADRRPKAAFSVVQRLFREAPHFPLPEHPFVSVVVASYNGAKTLTACLESLQHLNYPRYEVILVDDGSTDDTPQIAAKFPSVRYFRHGVNLGLSNARNTGIQAAEGEIVAFTDSDCRADEDWLHYLIGDLLNSKFAGIGGHNFLPPEDSWIAAAVMVSPGGPAHVMLTDRIAEHIPGCNMAFYKWALLEIGGFDPIFRKAGDDVDVCWRLQQRGCAIGFSPGGFVWHYRRSTAYDYLKQQHGYGEAEALLVHRHPEYFNMFGGSQWQGRIYSPAKFGIVTRSSMIYHGTFGSGFFQTLYAASPAYTVMLMTSLEYHVLLTLPLLVLGVVFRMLIPLAITSLLIPLGVCAVAAAQAELAPQRKRIWSRPLIALLFFLQPIVRGWARYQGRLSVRQTSLASQETFDSASRAQQGRCYGILEFWNERGFDRVNFLVGIMDRLEKKSWPHKADAGWNRFDLEIFGSRWIHLHLLTAAEAWANNKQMIRCRLRPVWTLYAKTVFGGVAALELLVLGVIGSVFPWLWLMLLSLPALAWWMRQQERALQRVVAVFLESAAREMGLAPIDPSQNKASSPPAAAPVAEVAAEKATGENLDPRLTGKPPKSPAAPPFRTAP